MYNRPLAVLWGCNIAAVAVMLFRLFLRKYRGSMFRLSDHLTFVAIACLFGRLSMMHVATLWGTNQFTGKPKTLKQTEIDQRRIGSILRLVSRPLLNTYFWLLKVILFLFLRQLIRKLKWESVIVPFYWTMLAATFVAVQVTTFTDCRSLRHYWEVVQPTERCVLAYGQLFTLGILSIITNFMLMILPLPAIYKVKRPLIERIRLAGIFGLALFVIIIDAYRVQQNYSSHASQFSRAVWISVATLGSAVVANVPSIYSNMRMSRSTRPRRRGVGYEKTPVPFWRAASDYKSDVSESSSKPVIMVERKIESRYDPA